MPYVTDVINLTDGLTAMLSLRVDNFVKEAAWGGGPDDYHQIAFSPKLGLVFQPVKEQVALFANYMNGFRNVDNVVQPDGQVSDFRPQQAWQWEGGIKLNLFGDKLNARRRNTCDRFLCRQRQYLCHPCLYQVECHSLL